MPRIFGSIIGVSGILGRPNIRIRHCERSEAIHRVTQRKIGLRRRNDEEIASPSRGTLRPRFAGYFRDLFKKEGAGNAGCTLHPRSRAQWSRWLRARAYRAAEAIRHSLRNGFTAYNVISPVIGFLATVTCRSLHKLDASAEASGPHDFAVRFSAVRRRHLGVHRSLPRVS